MRSRTRAIAIAGALLASTLAAHADEQAQIDFANGLFSRGFFEEASEEYRSYLAEYPYGEYEPEALYRLGESELAAKRYAEALSAFDRLLALTGTTVHDTRAVLRRGVALVELRDRARAETALKEAAKAQATSAEAWYYLGKLYFDAGQNEDSIRAFQSMTKTDPENPLAPFARYQLAFVHLKMGQDDKAAVQFSAVANAAGAPEALRVECRFRAAETYDRLGWFDAAVDAYRTLQRDYPDSDYAKRAAYGYAWSLYHSGHYAEATVAIDRFLRDSPDSPHAAGLTYLKANCFVQEKRYPEAIQTYGALRSRHPGTDFAEKAHYKIAWAYHFTGDDERALAELDSFLSDRQGKTMAGDAAFLRGEILAGQGNYADAYEEFRLVASQYAGSEFGPDALFKGGECLALMGRHREAMAAFDAYFAKQPRGSISNEALLRAGDAAFRAKDIGAAVDRYSQLAARAPGGTVEELTLYRLGTALHNIGNYKVCAETFLKLLARYPESKYAAEAHLLIADVFLRDAADPVQAISHYQEALDAAPKGKHAGDALKGLALARYESKDYPGAAESFHKLLVTHPSVRLNAQTYLWLGGQFHEAKEWSKSIAAYEAFVQRVNQHGQHALAWYRIGEARGELGKRPEAIEAFKRATALSPKSSIASDAQLRIARLLEEEGQIDEAIALYESSANANNGESAAQARFRLGEVYEEKKEYATAARHYMRVAILFLHEELSPESLLRAGACYARTGERQRARHTYQELLDDFPGSGQADEARRRLGQR